jgi:hypothetical protein
MYRLLHGDVYCGTRLVRFGLSTLDTCHRCFEPETIQHLLADCPYSRAVWAILGVEPDNLENILDGEMSNNAFEIRAEIISLLVFRKTVIPPEILVQTVMKAYADRLCYKRALVTYAQDAVGNFTSTGMWV